MRKVKVFPGMVTQLKGQALIDIVRLLDDDTKEHVWSCMCRYCKVWKQLIKLGVIEEGGEI